MRRALFLLTLAALLAACTGQQPSPPPSTSMIPVVATTTVLADLVKQVGGDRVTVHSLVPKGGEVHTFDPAPSDAAALSGARLLVMNGLGLDDWLLAFAQQAGAADVPVIELAEDIDEVEYLEGGAHEEEPVPGGPADEHRFNPHLWMNPAYAMIYVDRIRLKLIEIDPQGQQSYDSNAEAYEVRLEGLDAWVRQQMDAIPAERRRVVSFHDAFPYFAAAYDLEIIDVVVDAPGQEPSPAEVARVIEAIRDSQARAILAEAQFSDELADTIAEEADVAVVSDLYTDSLGDPPLDTYEGILRWDVDLIVAALR